MRPSQELLQHTTATLSAPEDSSTLTREDQLLLAIDAQVRALVETPRGRWIRRRITYHRDHPFARHRSETQSPSVDRRGIVRRLERIRTTRDRSFRSHPSTDAAPSSSSRSPEITLSPSEDITKKPHVRGPRAKALPKNRNHLSLDIPIPSTETSASAAAATTIIVTAASPTTPVHPVTLLPPREITPHADAVVREPEDTSADALVRMLAVLVRRSDVSTGDIAKLVEWAGIVYAVFVTEGDVEALVEGGDGWGTNDDAEAEAFWYLQAMTIGAGLEEVMRGSRSIASALARRVFWADEGLYRILVSCSRAGPVRG